MVEEPLRKRCKLRSTFTYPSAKHLPKNLNTKIVKSNFTKHTPATETIDGKKVAAQSFSDYHFVINTALSKEFQFDPSNLKPVVAGSSTAYGPVPLLCPVTNE